MSERRLTGRSDRSGDRREVGRAIRCLRPSSGRTLADVASQVGISVSLSSQVERGVADPSLDSLRDIAEVLGAAPFRLLADDAPRSRVVCGGQGRRFSLAEHDVEMEFLSPSLDGAFEIGRWTPWPGGTAVHPRGHQVTEATLILARTVGLARREETIELREGDLVTYHAPIPHRCTALGTRPGSSS